MERTFQRRTGGRAAKSFAVRNDMRTRLACFGGKPCVFALFEVGIETGGGADMVGGGGGGGMRGAATGGGAPAE